MGLSEEFWITTAIAIAGTIASIYFAIRHRKDGRVSVGVLKSAHLVSEVARDIPNLKVLYKDKEVVNELIWISGIVVNSGKIDLGETIIRKYPRLLLDEESEWQEFSLGDVDEEIEARRTVHSGREIEVSWSLLLPGETIPFTGLVKTKDDFEITVKGRIENTVCEYDWTMILPDDINRDIRMNLYAFILMGLFAFALSLFSLTVYSSTDPLAWRLIFLIAPLAAIAALPFQWGILARTYARYRYGEPDGSIWHVLRQAGRSG